MRRHRRRAALAAVVGLAAALALPGAAGRAQTAEVQGLAELRVCADPANLPFSNEAREGFENRVAEIVGRALGLPVSYVFFPQTVGFVRNTIRARQCDVVMGTVAGDELLQNTNPYYHTTYVAVFRRGEPAPPEDFADPAWRSLRIGVVANTPPADPLVRAGLMPRVRPYALNVDTRHEQPGRQMVRDVASGAIDVGLVWGPIAGWEIKQGGHALEMRPIPSAPGWARMDYRITMGVRAQEPEFRRRINAALRDHAAEIAAVLREYNVPLLDNQGRLVPP